MSDIVTYCAVVGHWSAKDIHILGLVENSTKCLGRPMVEGDFFRQYFFVPSVLSGLGMFGSRAKKVTLKK